ncbi:MAG: D-sedoheptulose 7-phosphate isomerase [Moorella sp. (in: firmicutes)]|nr:D-sedoheptulose 7-phosphate isomerase [Moorella sp. (in: firmicutes)]
MQASARRLFEVAIDIHRLLLDDNYLKNVIQVTEVWIEALKNGKKILFFGNGGSAADAQHLAGELVGKFKLERDALPALALNTNTSIITAIANDYDFNRVFERQVAALARPGDVAVGISTSGNSKNVLYGLQKAREIGAVTIGFLGYGGGIIRDVCDVALIVPANDTPRIQEAHILTGHVICELVEKALFEVSQ